MAPKPTRSDEEVRIITRFILHHPKLRIEETILELAKEENGSIVLTPEGMKALLNDRIARVYGDIELPRRLRANFTRRDREAKGFKNAEEARRAASPKPSDFSGLSTLAQKLAIQNRPRK